MKFPREVWAGSHLTRKRQMKRQIVNNLDEFKTFVQRFNNKMNCYTSVYDYRRFGDNQAVVSSVILDRLFLDFDSHGKDLELSLEDVNSVLKYLDKQEKYDLILIKQTIHFFSKKNLNRLLNLAKKRLNTKGKILIFSLKTKNNKIPCFKKMRKNLEKSLKRDEVLFKIIKKNLKKISYTNFNFKVNISKQKYVRMIKERYISCLLNMNNKEIKFGISEIKSKYKNQIKFTDTLKCISYRK